MIMIWRSINPSAHDVTPFRQALRQPSVGEGEERRLIMGSSTMPSTRQVPLDLVVLCKRFVLESATADNPGIEIS